MAHHSSKSKFYWILSTWLFICLNFLSINLVAKELKLAEPISNTIVSESFYILTDRGYGIDESALVRVELPPSYAKQNNLALEVDFRVYRIEDPLTFLGQQKDLHRVSIDNQYHASIAQMLGQVWNGIIKSVRMSWQRIFSAKTRSEVTKEIPQLKIPYQTLISAEKPSAQSLMFKPLTMPVVREFRYPIWSANPVIPPKEVNLSGSSSYFYSQRLGKTMVALGKLPAGLYLVEAMVENQRATTLLFVSDTALISKTSSNQVMAWTAHRKLGTPIGNSSLILTDGVGTLARAMTDKSGIAVINSKTPEHTYLIGKDAHGGIFVSENFYYDSEIYNTKIYAYTDKPLYQPGETVNIKVFLRDFINATDSKYAPSKPIQYEIRNPAGIVIVSGILIESDKNGAHGSFQLPKITMPGGYEITLKRDKELYLGEFRVAEYIKPHFDILLNTEQNLKTGKEIAAKIALRYPNGEPVKNAKIQLNIKKQQLSMVDGELNYIGGFPIELKQNEYETNDSGEVEIKLPKADLPSRYLLTILATDSAAYRVKKTREILIERGINPYKIIATKNFANIGEKIKFNFKPLGSGGNNPEFYEIIRLEDQVKEKGIKIKQKDYFEHSFSKPGSYSVLLKDKHNNLLGAINFWVRGEGMLTAPGTIEIVLDKNEYKVGDNAEALVTFSNSVNNALVTLERENVTKYGLLNGKSNWFSSKKVNDKQYLITVPITKEHSPNITLSVLEMNNGEYMFENVGLIVARPGINIKVKPNKNIYKPKEKVTIELSSLFEDKAVPANVAISVVDEMVYVLQPEVAPSINEFFYHPRRNNVSTQSSLNFIVYDKSLSAVKIKNEYANRRHERAVKVLERPRREDKDTAFWHPNLNTNAQGKAIVSFNLPDSLTRWRITVKAIDKEGRVGQTISYINTKQDYYLKWTGPNTLRANDTMQTQLMAFNETNRIINAKWLASNKNLSFANGKIKLNPGANYISLPIKKLKGNINIQLLTEDDKVLDNLTTNLSLKPTYWTNDQQIIVPINNQETKLNLPVDAKFIRLSLATSTEIGFNQIMDGLIEYPYGCVEQVSSRLIPLSIAYSRMSNNTFLRPIYTQIITHRLRLMNMAGESARFSWWGNREQDLFITTYAYFADWYAHKATLSKDDISFKPLTEMYTSDAVKLPIAQQYLVLWMFKEMGIPIKNLLEGADSRLKSELAKTNIKTFKNNIFDYQDNSADLIYLAALLSKDLHQQISFPLDESLQEIIDKAQNYATKSNYLLLRALLIKINRDREKVLGLLKEISLDYPTIERALILYWFNNLDNTFDTNLLAKDFNPESSWREMKNNIFGRKEWLWEGNSLPTVLNLNIDNTNSIVALIKYQSKSFTSNDNNIKITRRLYRLEPIRDKSKINQDDDYENSNQTTAFRAVAVKPGEALLSNALYIDEHKLSNKTNTKFNYMLIEAALPPGATLEGQTWGIAIAGLDDNKTTKPYINATIEQGHLSYRIPVSNLKGDVYYRQLIRFSQRGIFELPGSRVFKMYHPEQVYEEKNNLKIDVK